MNLPFTKNVIGKLQQLANDMWQGKLQQLANDMWQALKSKIEPYANMQNIIS